MDEIFETNLIGLRKLHEDLLSLAKKANEKSETSAYARGVAHAYQRSAKYLGEQIYLIQDLNKNK